MKISFSQTQTKIWASMLFLSFLSVSHLFSQSSEVGLVFGGGIVYGDIEIRTDATLQQTRPMAGLFYRYHPSNRWAVRGQLTVGQFSANEKRYPVASYDNYREKRGISFTTTLVELAIMPELRVFSVGNVDFYAFGGLGGFYFNPVVDYNEPNPVLGDKNLDKDAAFPKYSWAIPIGGGLRWFIKDQTTLGLELSGRKTGTDYLDGLSLMANPRVKDYYYFANLTVSKFFGSTPRGGSNMRGRKNEGCPTF